jgi:hypothetical protein
MALLGSHQEMLWWDSPGRKDSVAPRSYTLQYEQ